MRSTNFSAIDDVRDTNNLFVVRSEAYWDKTSFNATNLLVLHQRQWLLESAYWNFAVDLKTLFATPWCDFSER